LKVGLFFLIFGVGGWSWTPKPSSAFTPGCTRPSARFFGREIRTRRACKMISYRSTSRCLTHLNPPYSAREFLSRCHKSSNAPLYLFIVFLVGFVIIFDHLYWLDCKFTWNKISEWINNNARCFQQKVNWQ
jgi:hypothetical protein